MDDPFRGTSNRRAWTGGRRPSTLFSVPLGDFSDVQLPKELSWRFENIKYLSLFLPFLDFLSPSHRKELLPATIPMRSNAGVSIVEWATMGYWRSNQFFLLVALSARLPDVYVACWRASNSQGENCFLALRVSDRLHISWGSGSSFSAAKANAAELLIRKADLFQWLSENHLNTPCERYLRPASAV